MQNYELLSVFFCFIVVYFERNVSGENIRKFDRILPLSQLQTENSSFRFCHKVRPIGDETGISNFLFPYEKVIKSRLHNIV